MPGFTQSPSLDADSRQFLENIIDQFDLAAAEEIKTIEQTTNHDVKAIEYYLHNKIKNQPKINSIYSFHSFWLYLRRY